MAARPRASAYTGGLVGTVIHNQCVVYGVERLARQALKILALSNAKGDTVGGFVDAFAREMRRAFDLICLGAREDHEAPARRAFVLRFAVGRVRSQGSVRERQNRARFIAGKVMTYPSAGPFGDL